MRWPHRAVVSLTLAAVVGGSLIAGDIADDCPHRAATSMYSVTPTVPVLSTSPKDTHV